jgi:hypothetical protein
VASAQVPSLLQTWDEHSEFATQARQVNIPVLQTGIGFLQSAEVRQATHSPLGELQRGVAELCAMHCASSLESWQARQRWSAQTGAVSLHSADDEQNMSGPATAGISEGACMSDDMMQE